ncbi:MAG: preprotein translocase subunit SecG [Oscillospiraceae bacterium]|nr:preprotein translocase subunit SecG [Oscillospiraceae bacterium]
MEIVLSVLVSVLSIALIAVVLMQDGKDQGLGALAGNADSYLNKTGKDGKSVIASSTKWLAAAWLVCVLAMSFVH